MDTVSTLGLPMSDSNFSNQGHVSSEDFEKVFQPTSFLSFHAPNPDAVGRNFFDSGSESGRQRSPHAVPERKRGIQHVDTDFQTLLHWRESLSLHSSNPGVSDSLNSSTLLLLV